MNGFRGPGGNAVYCEAIPRKSVETVDERASMSAPHLNGGSPYASVPGTVREAPRFRAHPAACSGTQLVGSLLLWNN